MSGEQNMNLFHLIRLMALEQESFPLLVIKMGFFRQFYRLSRMFYTAKVTLSYIRDDSWVENVFVELIDLEILDRSVIKVVQILVEEMQFEVAYCKTRNSASEFRMRFFLISHAKIGPPILVPSAQIHQNI